MNVKRPTVEVKWTNQCCRPLGIIKTVGQYTLEMCEQVAVN